MAKKTSFKGIQRVPSRPQSAKMTVRAMESDSADPDNPDIPLGGMKIQNNADGSLTVRSTHHTVTIRAGGAEASGRVTQGGIVVVGLRRGDKSPAGAIKVNSPNQLAKRLRTAGSTSGGAQIPGKSAADEIHISLLGSHTLDVDKLSPILGGKGSNLAAYIYMHDDDPPIPLSG